MLPLHELKEKLIEQWDEVDLIDFLGLTSKDITDAFEEKIIDKQREIEAELELGEYED